MILYNVTVNLAPEIEQDWLQWVQKEHQQDRAQYHATFCQ